MTHLELFNFSYKFDGDLLHVSKQKSGMRENRFLCGPTDIKYRNLEVDTVRVPKYYKQIKESINYYFHCQGLKSDINLIIVSLF